MDIEKQLEVAAQSDHLVLIVFYADWSPHYEWIGLCSVLMNGESLN